MQNMLSTPYTHTNTMIQQLKNNWSLFTLMLIMLLLPFLIALWEGQSIGSVLANEAGSAKFFQGLLVEVFILAIFAISYDLVLGISGILSFGHAMFFAAGAYFTGIAFKNLEWGLGATLAGLAVVALVQALLFGLVLWRVQGITFALVTLGMAAVFQIIVMSSELQGWTGADVGLQGVIVPDFLNTNGERFRLYLIALFSLFFIYLLYRRFVDSPTGRVCIATRENENRARMLGYNTWQFKLVVLITASLTAVYAGFLHTIHQPIVSPNVAGLGWTVAALLIILIGGMGTLSGAVVGAAVFRLLEFFLDKWFGNSANFLLGLIYILIVLFLPYGLVGTWQIKRMEVGHGRAWFIRLLTKKPRSWENEG